ncbi:glycoside hydrolase 43 family protein [Asticcacaulis sp. AND118]|uniref:glycoside hydrolase family 43 protein n=1 Tax=Asticcacaulis sp. AND118 TaxID=2840468 RepID=UPI001CFF7B07|nr:glycoside hydrolase 43 family protein [Asticcacaulis sp. AND118]UDF05590.1 glycoside hydrolase 43 family protein [Asticcacaulis sp. AND118]
MKTLLLGTCLALLPLAGCAAVSAQTTATYSNPVLYADYSDPDVIRVGQSYYMVSSSFHFSPGIPVLKSDDLVHWSIIGHVLPKLTFAPEYDMPGPYELDDTRSKPVTGTKYASGVWAPSIRHHNGLFYVYWATPDEGVFMSTAQSPEGPWAPPVHVIAQPKLEDPCPFWDDDGQAFLIHGKVGAGPLILHRMSPDGTKVLDEGVVVAEDKMRLPILEGPKVYKRNGWYYIFAPIGGVGTGPQAVGRARNIYGPYEWRDVLVPIPGILGPHQGGYVETPAGQGWFLHFNSTGAFGRINHLQPVVWRDDWPVMGDEGKPVLTHSVPDTGVRSNARLQDSDSFDSRELGLQWSWNHNPDIQRWSLSARPGWLRLEAQQANHLTTARNTLTQILQGPAMQTTTRMDVSRMADGQRAGLSLFGVKPVWIGVVRENGVARLTYASAGVETPGPEITGATVILRAEVQADQIGRFAYSLDEKAFTPFGEALPLSTFSWWKGSRPALFTFNKIAAQGSVDFDWVRVTHEVK